MNARRGLSTPRAQRGLSMVELMVGVTVGLFVVAAATALVAGQLADNRRLLLETQVQQDLRATMDIITRQMRRAGSAPVSFAEGNIASAPGTGGTKNPYSVLSTTGTTQVEFKYLLDASEERFGFKLDGNALWSFMQRTAAGGAWQQLTDPNALTVTAFAITEVPIPSEVLPCPKECPGGGSACWPVIKVRSFVVEIQAQAKNDASVKRGIRNDVRLRNDYLDYRNAAAPANLCPA